MFQKPSGILPGETLKKRQQLYTPFCQRAWNAAFYTTWPKKRSPFCQGFAWLAIGGAFCQGLAGVVSEDAFCQGLAWLVSQGAFCQGLARECHFFAFCQGLGAIATFCQGSSSSFRISCAAVAKSAYQLFTFHLPLFLFRV